MSFDDLFACARISWPGVYLLHRRNLGGRQALIIFFAFAQKDGRIEMAGFWFRDNFLFDAVQRIARSNRGLVNQLKLGSGENRVSIRVVCSRKSPQESDIEMHPIVSRITCDHSVIVRAPTPNRACGLAYFADATELQRRVCENLYRLFLRAAPEEG